MVTSYMSLRRERSGSDGKCALHKGISRAWLRSRTSRYFAADRHATESNDVCHLPDTPAKSESATLTCVSSIRASRPSARNDSTRVESRNPVLGDQPQARAHTKDPLSVRPGVAVPRTADARVRAARQRPGCVQAVTDLATESVPARPGNLTATLHPGSIAARAAPRRTE